MLFYGKLQDQRGCTDHPGTEKNEWIYRKKQVQNLQISAPIRRLSRLRGATVEAVPVSRLIYGHFPHFYSVGQHSVLCMKEAEARGYSRRVQLGALLHDAGEAYLSDVTRPIKPLLPVYLEAEKTLQGMIFDKWIAPALTEEEMALIREIDDAILHYEFLKMMGHAIYDPAPFLASDPNFDFVMFDEIERAFLQGFEKLIAE